MMSVVKMLRGRRGRWVVVAAAAVGLAGVTAWMLAEGDRGVEIAAVLGFPVAVLGVLVAALGLLVAFRGNTVTSTPPPGEPPDEGAKSPGWSVRQRIALAAGALVMLAATVAGVVIRVIMLTDPTHQPSPPSPSILLHPDLSALRDADPCLLIDENALRAFGTLQSAVSPWLQGCEVAILIREGVEARLRVNFGNADSEEPEYNENILDFEHSPACQSRRLPAKQPSIQITTLTHSSEPIDLCAITKSATTTVDNIIGREGSIPSTPNRTSGYSHAGHNACDTLDHATFSKHGLDLTDRTTGFANWTCFWNMKDGTQVSVLFGLGDLDYHDFRERTTIAEKDAFLDRSSEERCIVYVVHRSALAVAEMFHVTVEGPLAADQRCNLAVDLAPTVEKKLSD
jgi:hypothetical protein